MVLWTFSQQSHSFSEEYKSDGGAEEFFEKNFSVHTGLQGSGTAIEIVTEELHRNTSSSQGGTISQLDSHSHNVLEDDNGCWRAFSSSSRNPKFPKATAGPLCAQIKGVREAVNLSEPSGLGSPPSFGEENTKSRVLISGCQLGRDAATTRTLLLEVENCTAAKALDIRTKGGQ